MSEDSPVYMAGDTPIRAPRRLALVLLDLISQGLSRCGAGFGKYPLGLRDAVEALLPLVPPEDPAAPAVAAAWARFIEKLNS